MHRFQMSRQERSKLLQFEIHLRGRLAVGECVQPFLALQKGQVSGPTQLAPSSHNQSITSAHLRDHAARYPRIELRTFWSDQTMTSSKSGACVHRHGRGSGRSTPGTAMSYPS